MGHGFHERINVHAVSRAGDVVHGRDTGHIFVADRFDARQQGDFFRELFDNAQCARVEDAVFVGIVVEDTDHDEIAYAEAFLDHPVIFDDRVVGREICLDIALKAQALQRECGQNRTGEGQYDDQPSKTDDPPKK